MDKLKHIRIQKGLTQEQIAKESGISIGTIKRIEGKSDGVAFKNIKTYLDILEMTIIFRSNDDEESVVERFTKEIFERIQPKRTRVRATHRYGWVYILKHNDIIKIGVTQHDDPETRCDQIQEDTGRNCSVYYAKLVKNMFDIERQMHIYFDSERLDGEWFSTNKETAKRYLENLS